MGLGSRQGFIIVLVVVVFQAILTPICIYHEQWVNCDLSSARIDEFSFSPVSLAVKVPLLARKVVKIHELYGYIPEVNSNLRDSMGNTVSCSDYTKWGLFMSIFLGVASVILAGVGTFSSLSQKQQWFTRSSSVLTADGVVTLLCFLQYNQNTSRTLRDLNLAEIVSSFASLVGYPLNIFQQAFVVGTVNCNKQEMLGGAQLILAEAIIIVLIALLTAFLVDVRGEEKASKDVMLQMREMPGGTAQSHPGYGQPGPPGGWQPGQPGPYGQPSPPPGFGQPGMAPYGQPTPCSTVGYGYVGFGLPPPTTGTSEGFNNAAMVDEPWMEGGSFTVKGGPPPPSHW